MTNSCFDFIKKLFEYTYTVINKRIKLQNQITRTSKYSGTPKKLGNKIIIIKQ